MAPEMVCELPNVPLTDDFEDLLENMELDEGLLRELLQGMDDDDDDNMDQTSTTETMANDVLPVKEKNGLPFDNEMMPFWHVENQAEYNMIDDIAYVELWEK
uniref:Uncharacterized protein n=1 Tax=Tanacetum cinerariifolium TaxID=118510 RepID=A0A6L2JZ20_TANCI|nr:hypothetical protein [Tanacetum cinerariifolium]